MINLELRLHGHLNDRIEYYATAAGYTDLPTQFYQRKGDRLRFFAPGNELVLGEDGIRHLGNGGSFCNYMFGVDQPLADLAKEGVRNRLILFGTRYEEDGQLSFSDQTEGHQDLNQIFLEGHAVSNTFFFLHGLSPRSLQQQQRSILEQMGRTLKRTSRAVSFDDAALCAELLQVLEPGTTIYLIRLIHKHHQQYQDLFRSLYFARHGLAAEDQDELDQLGSRLQIDPYQQERIRIDVMYNHRDNYRVVDEYKKVLIACRRAGRIDAAAQARLSRLRILAVRKNIPSALYLALDEQLNIDCLKAPQEADYIASTRQVLQGLLLVDDRLESGVDRRDVVVLLEAKLQAARLGDHTFEHLLLETGKVCDERIRDGADLQLLENFSYIVTFFDRYDACAQQISQLAFMPGFDLSEEMLRSLFGSREAFESLQPGLFARLFLQPVQQNPYLGRYGQRKIFQLHKGLEQIASGSKGLQSLQQELAKLDQEERLYDLLLHQAKRMIRDSYSRYYTRREQDELLEKVLRDLEGPPVIPEALARKLFDDVVMQIKKEAVYLHNILPMIIEDQDQDLREDFLLNSGLDRFVVEELEREYFSRHDLDPGLLACLRAG